MTSLLSRALLALPLLWLAVGPRQLSAQINGIPAPAESSTPSPNAAQQQSAASDPQKPSSLIAPAVDHLSEVVSQVQLERWKSSSRDETDGNLRSVERNLKSTLPDLVTAADAQPSSVAASLPVLRNLDALCAVMIRVSVAARANAPAPQAESLAGALTALQSARNTLSDQVLTLAAAQEKQIATLQSTVATLTAKSSTPPPAPVSATTSKKKKSQTKPASKSTKGSKPLANPPQQ